MEEQKRMTALNSSVGADEGQSNQNTIVNIADTDNKDNDNFFDEEERRLLRLLDPNHLNTVSMNELYETVYSSKPPLIDGFLYPGLYLFAGSPKIGKSFFMAQLAYHISTGTPLWGYPAREGTVLYLALEDDYSRLQKRLYQMFGTEAADKLHFAVTAAQLGKGLDEQLHNFVYDHTDTVLIIIDTLQKVRELGGDSYSYASDYEIVARLKSFADSKGICLVVVHHTRKQKADDRFDMISGTNGLLGAADGAFLLQKEKRTSDSATLDVAGRDQRDQRFYLVRNQEHLVWDLEKVETDIEIEKPDPLFSQVADMVNESWPDWEGTAADLVELLGLDIQPNKLTMKLNINAGKLMDEYGIKYESTRTHNGRKVKLHYEKA